MYVGRRLILGVLDGQGVYMYIIELCRVDLDIQRCRSVKCILCEEGQYIFRGDLNV